MTDTTERTSQKKKQLSVKSTVKELNAKILYSVDFKLCLVSVIYKVQIENCNVVLKYIIFFPLIPQSRMAQLLLLHVL